MTFRTFRTFPRCHFQRCFTTSPSVSSKTLELSSLSAISGIDGRYGRLVKHLRPYFSEYGLIKYRVRVEVEWLKYLATSPSFPEVVNHPSAITFLDELAEQFTSSDASRVKEIERTTNHDVKAVEYFLKERLTDRFGSTDSEVGKLSEFIHFSCTSEDINNLSYALLLKEAREVVLLPEMDAVIDKVTDLADAFADAPMLARTHGQSATPTTVGKELANFAYRLHRQKAQFRKVKMLGKVRNTFCCEYF